MKITVLFFGILAEEAGMEKIELKDIRDLSELREKLFDFYPSFRRYKFGISVNQVLEHDNKKLSDGDEVALLPPFAGG